MKNLDKLSAKLCSNIGVKRYEHTLRVVDYAGYLAQVYDLDVEQAKLATLLHDCGREIGLQDSVSYLRRHGQKINKTESLQPILLHARIGRLIAEHKYAVTDKQILQAIEYHTTGNKDMDSLAMLVYVADMLEPERAFPGVEQLRSLVGQVSLPNLMLACLRSTLEHLLSAGLLIHTDSIKTYNSLVNMLKKENSSKLRGVSL